MWENFREKSGLKKVHKRAFSHGAKIFTKISKLNMKLKTKKSWNFV